jgi:UDP-N-acetyl-alpha-D-muramoyl-L-alanyl-L-glutamate epimerase
VASTTQRNAADRFEPAAISSFRFLDRGLDERGEVTLRYALDDAHEFVERFTLPLPAGGPEASQGTLEGLVSLLHWVAGVSYFKAALPPSISCETGAPPPATASLLEALYSEGLGELAVVNGLSRLPEPAFGTGQPGGRARTLLEPGLRSVLVPIGGGKDSVVALELVRRAGARTTLFSLGDAAPIAATAAVVGLPRLIATRILDPRLLDLNRAGAINGHVPITAIVGCVALLVAALHGIDAVALANERSASAPNTTLGGVPVNHQFSKSARAELLLRAAVAEVPGAPALFSVLRPASELAIARAFARLPAYHDAFTSCNRVFSLDPGRRTNSWCGDCDKCRFVFLILAPFLDPPRLRGIFERDLLDDDAQFDGFARLTGTGGHKPFECVGEVQESVAAIRLLVRDRRWREHAVVARLEREVLPRFAATDGDPVAVFALSDEHNVPGGLIDSLRALLGA